MTSKKAIISSKNYELHADGSVTDLLSELTSIIESGKSQVASYANASLVMLNWHIGRRINRDILQEERAGYGEKIIKHLSKELILRYGNRFDARALFRIVKFAKIYDDEQIVATLSRLLSWSKFIELLELATSGIHVAKYLTELPAKEILEARLNAVIEGARSR